MVYNIPYLITDFSICLCLEDTAIFETADPVISSLLTSFEHVRYPLYSLIYHDGRVLGRQALL